MCVSVQCSREGRFRFRWKTVPAVPVPPSVSGKTVPTVPVSGSGSVPEPPCFKRAKLQRRTKVQQLTCKMVWSFLLILLKKKPLASRKRCDFENAKTLRFFRTPKNLAIFSGDYLRFLQ